jgi:ATP phosphoribosyltransferase regulatory subunit
MLKSRLEAIDTIAAAIGERATLTLDPTEQHGFEYQSWIGFSLFGNGLSGEIGRGGAYTIVDAEGGEEEAVGFSLFLDPLVDAGLGQEPRHRIFIPLGSHQAAAAALRKEGWITIAALSAQDDGQALGCTHLLQDGIAKPY